MNKSLEKTLMNSKLLVISGVIAAMCYLVSEVPHFFLEYYQLYKFDFLIQLVVVFAIIALLISYKKGETNLQKALLSGLLFYSFAGTFTNAVYALDDLYVGYPAGYNLALLIIFSVAEGAILISHLALQTEHAGSVKPIKIITWAVVIGIIVNIVDAVVYLKNGVNYGALYLINNIGEDFLLIMILCIETKIQYYKRTRAELKANDEWTPEAKAKAKDIFQI